MSVATLGLLSFQVVTLALTIDYRLQAPSTQNLPSYFFKLKFLFYYTLSLKRDVSV